MPDWTQPRFIHIFEVGPRDGLQNEKDFVPTDKKIALINALSTVGLKKIEATSFVSPKWVPQMQDASAVMAGIKRVSNVRYAALTPNIRGFERALKAKCDEIAIFVSASQGFSHKNINASIAQSLQRFEAVAHQAKQANIPMRGYVSCMTDCPYDGVVDPAQTLYVTKALFKLGCYEVSLGDTIGAATPDSTERLLTTLSHHVDMHKLAGHFHDTKGNALANIAVCLDHGISSFDSAIAGLGGCPYAKGATGNIATEKLVRYLHENNFITDIDEAKLHALTPFATSLKTVY